jgi:Chaperone of endosialidase
MFRISAYVCAVLLLARCVLPMNAQQAVASTNVAVPQMVNYSGVLLDANGKPLSGFVGVTFSLYKESQGGAPLWTETQNVQADKAGHYTAALGSSKSQGMPAEIFASGEARWLGVQAQGQAEQSRVLLMSVPYALKALDAETIGGRPASSFMLAPAASGNSGKTANLPPGTITGSGTADFIPRFTGTTTIGNSNIFETVGANVGIGTTTPAAKLDVKGTQDVRDTLTLFPKTTHPVLSVHGTAFAVNSTGVVTFVAGQTFPGTGTVTSVGSGLGLKGGPITTSGTLSIDTSVVPQLGTSNSFTGNQAVNGTVSASQVISTVATGTPPLTVNSVTLVPNLNASYLGGYAASQFQPAGSYATLGANSFTGSQTVAGNVNTNGGELEPPGTVYYGIRWLDGSGNIQAHLHRFGAVDNNLYVTNDGPLDLTGVYLASGATSWTSTSDERLKTNIVPVTGILDKIRKIRVVAFDMDSLSVDRSTGKPSVHRDVPPRRMKDGTVIRQQIGSIAQDWVATFPQLVVEPQTDDQYYGLDYDRIGVVALGGVKELTALIEAKDAEIKALSERLATLEQALRQLTQQSEPAR